MAYDPATATVLLFGGIGADDLRTGAMVPLDYLDETWSWNGTTWTELHPPASPPSYGEASMAYDPGTQAMLLVEDADEGYGQLSLTWTLRAPSPPGGH